jgi:hypothetical protein
MNFISLFPRGQWRPRRLFIFAGGITHEFMLRISILISHHDFRHGSLKIVQAIRIAVWPWSSSPTLGSLPSHGWKSRFTPLSTSK